MCWIKGNNRDGKVWLIIILELVIPDISVGSNVTCNEFE